MVRTFTGMTQSDPTLSFEIVPAGCQSLQKDIRESMSTFVLKKKDIFIGLRSFKIGHNVILADPKLPYFWF
jgi:hypothetical protein